MSPDKSNETKVWKKDAVAMAIETGILELTHRHPKSGNRWLLYRCAACGGELVNVTDSKELRRWGIKHLHGLMLIEDEHPER